MAKDNDLWKVVCQTPSHYMAVPMYGRWPEEKEIVFSLTYLEACALADKYNDIVEIHEF